MPKLCQIIAVAAGLKSRTAAQITELHHKGTKETLTQGLSRVYQPLGEANDKKPSESKLVQVKVMKVLEDAAAAWTGLFDVVLTQDVANCEAKADVVVDGAKILRDVPVTNLLFLEKQLTDVFTFFEKLPTLDPAMSWSYDANRGFHVTDPVSTLSTTKIQEPLVLAPATDKHPAQVQLVGKDVTVGTWILTLFSGAIQADLKKTYLEKIVKLQDAVKFAREQANQIEVTQQSSGKEIFKFILGG